MKTSQSILETLFEHRNKEYGAYELRTHYHNRLFKSFAAALTVLTLLFAVPMGIGYLLHKFAKPKVVFNDTPVDMGETFSVEKPVHPKTEPPSSPKRSSVDATIHIVKDTAVKNSIEPKRDSIDSGSTNGKADTGIVVSTNNVNGGGGKPQKDTTTITMSVASVDVVPSFPGGEKALMNYLTYHIRLNDKARREGVNGKIYVSFVVNEKGEVVDVQIKQSLGYGLDEEVARVISTMPAWTPGLYHGRAVNTVLVQPVCFNVK